MADIPKANEIKQEVEKAILRADDGEVGAVIQNRNLTIASVASIKEKLRVLRANLDDWLADVNLTAGNIKSGVKIFGLTGTFPNDGTAQTGEVLTGKTFYNDSATKRTGTMPNRGAVIITPSTSNQTIQAGYHNGQGYVKGDPNLKATNITEGVSIFGVAGSVPRVIEISDKMAILDLIDYGDHDYIRALTFDGTHLYVGGGARTVWKINPSNMSKVAESADYGGHIYTLIFDGTHLYAAGSAGTVWKINPSNMSKVAESAYYSNYIRTLVFDGTHLYAGGSGGTVWKINPSNMSKVTESADYGGHIYILTFDGTYLYAAGSARTVWKINPSNMSKVAESADYGDYIRALTFDGTHLYVGGDEGRIWKINPSNMSKVAESAYYVNNIYTLAFDGTYLYAGGDAGRVWKINPSNMSKVAESAYYGDYIYILTFDGTYLYVGGSDARKVWKMLSAVYRKEV